MTAITRESSNSTFPEQQVDVRKADLTSVESVAKALEGQDAVVVATAIPEMGNQYPIIDGALQAGVKRIVPSEYGHNCRPGKIHNDLLARILSPKTKTVDYLVEKARENPGRFTWTGLATWLFLDWVIIRFQVVLRFASNLDNWLP